MRLWSFGCYKRCKYKSETITNPVLTCFNASYSCFLSKVFHDLIDYIIQTSVSILYINLYAIILSTALIKSKLILV